MVYKRVMVTGGAGVIGTALVERLLEEKAIVWVGDLKPCPKRWLGKVLYRQGDLNTLTQEEVALFDPEIVFHLAATFERSKESFPFFEENFTNNIRLSHHLIQCLKGAESLKKIVFASSYLIYDPHLYQSATKREGVCSLTEESLIYPRNLCGAAKLFHEIELRFLNEFQSDVSMIAARIFRVYGRRSRDIISRWIRAALRDEKLKVYRPEGQFDYIFADDVAEGLIKLSTTSENGIVNLGSGRARSVQEVIDILRFHFPHLETEFVASDIPFENSQASIHKLEELTSWDPPHDLETGIEKLIAFEKEELAHPAPPPEQASLLITSIAKKMPLINAVRTAADKTGQFNRICGCDSHSDCIGQYGVDEFWNCLPLSKFDINEVISYCQKNRIKVIIPTRDGDLDYYSKHKATLERVGIHTMVSDHTAIETCLDKLLFAEFLTKHHFPTIKTSLSIDEIEAHKYVVKERFGAGSQLIGLNLTREEAINHAKILKEPIFQPYIEGIEWSVDLYRTKEGHIKGSVARRRDLVVRGESQVTTTVQYPALDQLCRAIVDKLSLYAHSILQVIVDQNGDFHVIECNPRFGGASTASIAVGLDSFYWFLLESLGQPGLEAPFMRSKHEIRQIRYATDKIIIYDNTEGLGE